MFYRALTGTPVQNNLDDLYSLLKFLHIAPFSEYKWYRRLIVRPLQVIKIIEEVIFI